MKKLKTKQTPKVFIKIQIWKKWLAKLF